MEENKNSNAGHPPLFGTPEAFRDKVVEYFEYIKGGKQPTGQVVVDDGGNLVEVVKEVKPQPATITGLCLFLGFTSRQSFYDYAKRPKFKDVVDYAKLCIENRYEINLTEAKNPTGAIFVLKNMGWSDKIEQVVTDKSEPKSYSVKIVK